jgi:hypothetical protein
MPHTLLLCSKFHLRKVMGMDHFLWLHLIFWNLYKFFVCHFFLGITTMGDNHVTSFTNWINLVVNNLSSVATLALGSQPRQGGCKVAGQKRGRESHHMVSGVQKVQKVWGKEPSHSQVNSHCGSWSPKSSKHNFRGQNPYVWRVLYIIGKPLKHRFKKWAHIACLDI